MITEPRLSQCKRSSGEARVREIAVLAAVAMAAMTMGQAAPQGSPGTEEAAPVRLARISKVQGTVSWRPDESVAWSPATINMPLRQGAQIWVDGTGDAEIQFDDGSDVRLGNGAVLTFQSLYSDAQGEFTELKLNDGASSLNLLKADSIYQVDTPFNSVKATGPTRLRVDVGQTVSVGVREGDATLTSQTGDTPLHAGDFVVEKSADEAIRVGATPEEDAFDQVGHAGNTPEPAHVPEGISRVAGDMNGCGTWHEDADLGWVWHPDVAQDWQPYSCGHWVWVEPFGWTWVSTEAWGWAPYHFGAWSHLAFGWCWSPGPARQCWCPAVVHFTSCNGSISWVPLSPHEVRYASFRGEEFRRHDWYGKFSILGCASYAPVRGGWCEPVRFTGSDLRGSGFRGERELGRGPILERTNVTFVPRNARFGATTVLESEFGGREHLNTERGDSTRRWTGGKPVGAESHAFSGPVTARPIRESWSSSHELTTSKRPPSLDRPLYRAPVSEAVERMSQPFAYRVSSGPSRESSNRPGRLESGDRAESRALPHGSEPSRSTPTFTPSEAVRRARESLGYARGSGGPSSSSGASRSQAPATSASPQSGAHVGSSGQTAGSSSGYSNTVSSRSSGTRSDGGYGYGRSTSGSSAAGSSGTNSGGGSGYGRASSGSSGTSSARSSGTGSSGGYGYGRSSSGSSGSSGTSNGGGYGSGRSSGSSTGSGGASSSRSQNGNGSGGYGYDRTRSSGAGSQSSSGSGQRSSSSGGKSGGSSNSSSGRGSSSNSGQSPKNTSSSTDKKPDKGSSGH